MNITLKTNKNRAWGKTTVRGSVLGYSRKKQVQEHLETIYYLGFLRVVIKHEWKFKPYS